MAGQRTRRFDEASRSSSFRMLAEKRQELADQANKLRSGLSKIDDTRLKVNEMAAELEVTQEQVHKSARECEEFLVTIGTRQPLTMMYYH